MLTILVFTMHHVQKLQSEGLRTRDAHLLQALNRHPRVSRLLVVDRPVTRPERLLRRRISSAGASLAPAKLGLEKVEYVRAASRASVRPMRLRSEWWLHAYEPSHLSARSLQSIAEAVGLADAALCFVPTAHCLWREQVPTVLDLLDNWLVHPQLGGTNPEAFARAYRRSLSSAEWVTANSEGTRDLAYAFGRDALLLTNGVDKDALQRRARCGVDTWAERLKLLPRPWLVYAGKMQQRLDVELLADIARRVPGSLILAGPVLNRAWMRPVLRSHGVTWLRDVAYEDLPGLLACADIGLIPHRVGTGEVGGDPLKAQEYAAVGLRFVSTRITGAARIGAKGIVAGSSEEFVAAVRTLGCDDRSLDERLTSAIVPADETWDSKAESIVSLVDSRSFVRPAAASEMAGRI
jgi:glycosyl transferase family 1